MTALGVGPVRLSVLRDNSRYEHMPNISCRVQHAILL